ncbi:hypothetical protein LXA43DRAFT_291032 [Ganoderma leucocontextum]|nr:hypothetical protein LXA43DRAFT_291032 [Ganoderma leucocontextum]
MERMPGRTRRVRSFVGAPLCGRRQNADDHAAVRVGLLRALMPFCTITISRSRRLYAEFRCTTEDGATELVDGPRAEEAQAERNERRTEDISTGPAPLNANMDAPTADGCDEDVHVDRDVFSTALASGDAAETATGAEDSPSVPGQCRGADRSLEGTSPPACCSRRTKVTMLPCDERRICSEEGVNAPALARQIFRRRDEDETDCINDRGARPGDGGALRVVPEIGMSVVGGVAPAIALGYAGELRHCCRNRPNGCRCTERRQLFL